MKNRSKKLIACLLLTFGLMSTVVDTGAVPATFGTKVAATAEKALRPLVFKTVGALGAGVVGLNAMITNWLLKKNRMGNGVTPSLPADPRSVGNAVGQVVSESWKDNLTGVAWSLPTVPSNVLKGVAVLGVVGATSVFGFKNREKAFNFINRNLRRSSSDEQSEVKSVSETIAQPTRTTSTMVKRSVITGSKKKRRRKKFAPKCKKAICLKKSPQKAVRRKKTRRKYTTKKAKQNPQGRIVRTCK